MARRPIADANAQRIASAYLRAKAANPKLTQKEFARKAMPTVAKRWRDAKTPAEKRRIEESGARYLRLVLEGKRTGRVNVERAVPKKRGASRTLFQIIVRDKHGNARSFNITSEGSYSALDIPYIEQQLRESPEILDARRREWAYRYADDFADFDIDDVSVEKIATSKVPLHASLWQDYEPDVY